MKTRFAILTLLFFAISRFFFSCDKVDPQLYYANGKAPDLTASSTNLTPAPADSDNVVVTFSWSYPEYATDSSLVKYIIEIDSSGRNFTKASRREITGSLSTSYLAREINDIMLGYGFEFGKAYNLDVRLTSSYPNNNEQFQSNILTLTATPYKIPPKIEVPASGTLFIVGSATEGGDSTGWDNPVPVPSQEFSRLDETTFAGIFFLHADKSYLLLPVNGSWDVKYGGTGSNNSNDVNGDDFMPGGSDLKSPVMDGMYKIVIDFQSGRFKVEPYAGSLASELFIVGNATPGGDSTGWDNPVPVPEQEFTRLNSSLFELTIALNANKSYLLLPVNGSWDEKYGGLGGNNSNNVLGDEFKLGGSDLKSPEDSAVYKISVNFAAGASPDASGRFALEKQ